MDLLSRAFRNARPERRSVGGLFGDSSIMPNSVMMGQGANGSVMTETGALAISTVLNCGRVLYDDIGILPFKAYSGDKHGAKAPLAAQPQIVTEPFGPDIPVAVGMGQIVVSVKLRGNAFVRILDVQGGWPSLLQVLHPDTVKVRRDSMGRKCFDVRDSSTGGMVTFYSDTIKHIPGLMLPGALSGLDPVSYQRVTLGEAADVAQYGANFFRNGGSPSGVISVPAAGDRKKAREVKDTWEAGHSGVVNSHRPAVLFGGATWTPLSVAPENAQFLQTRSFLREEICGWFGVPLQRIMAITGHASQGGGKGLDSIDQGYATHTLVPLTQAIESVWNGFLPGGDRSWTGFDFSGLLRASTLERAQIAQVHRLTGVRNRNEIRADEGWSPIPGPDGADYNIPFNTNSAIPPLITEPGIADPADAADPASEGGFPA